MDHEHGHDGCAVNDQPREYNPEEAKEAIKFAQDLAVMLGFKIGQ